jgi:GBP family porin
MAALLAAGGCFGLVGTASAEGEATLYGEIDTGLVYTSSVVDEHNPRRGSRFSATSNNVGGSFIGLRGIEQLGGGATALFVIERGIDVNHGSGNDGQPMYVGLSHPAAGTLTLGRQNDSVNDYLAPLTLTGSDGGTYFAHPFDNDNANATYLVNHSVKWESPTWHGFHFGGQYAVSPAASTRPAWSVGAAFSQGPVSVAASYAQSGSERLEDDLGAAISETLAGSGVTSAPAGTPTLKQRIYGTGINYALGDVTLGAVWTHSRFEASGGAGNGAGFASAGRFDFDNYEANARYRASEALTLAAAYTFTQGKATLGKERPESAWHQAGLLADYAVSKRTSFYAEGIYQQAVDGGPAAFVNGVGPAGKDRQGVVSLGMRHRF